MLDVNQIAQGLINELNTELALNKGKIDGVLMLYERIREKAAGVAETENGTNESDNESSGQATTETEISK